MRTKLVIMSLILAIVGVVEAIINKGIDLSSHLSITLVMICSCAVHVMDHVGKVSEMEDTIDVMAAQIEKAMAHLERVIEANDELDAACHEKTMEIVELKRQLSYHAHHEIVQGNCVTCYVQAKEVGDGATEEATDGGVHREAKEDGDV